MVVARAALGGSATLRRHLLSLQIQRRGGGDVPPVTGISIDSRTIQPGELYVCITGERHDGHEFIDDAVHRGAAAVLVANDPGDLQE